MDTIDRQDFCEEIRSCMTQDQAFRIAARLVLKMTRSSFKIEGLKNRFAEAIELELDRIPEYNDGVKRGRTGQQISR